jgi:AcrR family transcriptional regulator
MPDRPTRPMLDPAVREDFRRRAITTAVAELCAENGRLPRGIAGIAARAGTARATVYSLYPNREAIFLDLFDRTATEVLSVAEAACASAAREPATQIKAALAATLGWAAGQPAGAYAFLVLAPYATPASQRRYQEAISDLAALLRTVVPHRDPRTVRLEEIIIGGLAAVLARLAREGRIVGAPDLLEDFVGLVAAPFLPRAPEDMEPGPGWREA